MFKNSPVDQILRFPLHRPINPSKTEVSSEHPQQSNDQIQEQDPVRKKLMKQKSGQDDY